MCMHTHICIFLVTLLGTQLPNSITRKAPHKTWILKGNTNNTESNFITKYNFIQKQLKDFCGQDDLVSGFLSKAKGQLLRVATYLHVLLKIETPEDIDETIDEKPLNAAIDFIEVSCDHAFMITGRRNILHRLDCNNDGKYV